MTHTLHPGAGLCSRCGNANRDSARFCDACGASLQSAPVSGPQPLLDSEVKHVTVLFGDVVGSTEMVAGRTPDEAQAILTPAVDVMVEAVQALGGTVNRELGDGVMALFGAPVSQEDHAVRACCAALRMHEAAAALLQPFRLRVGIASGPILLSTLGAIVPGAYPAFGATLHLAARLQGLARPSTTLCAASTRVLTGPTVDLVALGPQALRGLGVEQNVFALTGVRQSDLRFSRSVARGLSPLVGRDRELAALFDLAHAVRTRAPAAVAVVGEAGAGKSRLAWEFAHRLQADSWEVIQVEAVSYGRDVPYQLIAALLRSCLGIDPADDPGKSAVRLRRRLVGFEETAVSAAALLSLLGLPLGADAAAWDRLDPLRRRDVLRDSVSALIGLLARGRPTLLLIEDLQWADEESLRLLDFLPASDCRLFLLTTHRPDFAPGWSKLVSSVLTLQPLSSSSMSRLVEQAFPGITSAGLRQALVERAAGNPFFLEELARETLAANTPQHAEQHEQQLRIPSTVQAVVAARIDRLAPEDKLVLVTASVLGNRVPLKTLRALFAGRPEASLQTCMEALCDAGMLRPLQRTDNDVDFSHALIQEVAYSGLPRGQRLDLHKQIVATIKRIDPDHHAEQVETLVYHAGRGEVWDELIVAARIAGKRAASRSAYVAASRFFRQAIEACEHLPRSHDTLATEIDLRFELRTALFPTAGIERSLENSTQAERLARQLGDRSRMGWATAYLARDLQLVGRPKAAIETAARALAFADGDEDLAAAARYFAAQAAYSVGDYATVVTTLRDLIEHLEVRDPTAHTGTPGPSIIFYRAWLTWALARMGRAAEAEATAREMRGLADEADLPLCRTIAHLSEGFALAFAGRLAEAESTLRVSLSLCRKGEFFAWSTNILSCLGHVLSRLGRFDEAFDLIEQAAERTRRSGIRVNHANELAWLAEAHRLAGRADEAARLAEQGIDVAHLHEERGNEALATVALADALTDLGSIVAGAAQYVAALRLANETGAALLAERCRAKLAMLDGAADPLARGNLQGAAA